jgi:hypothetical protein
MKMKKYARFMFSPHDLDIWRKPFSKALHACCELSAQQQASKTATPSFPFSNGLRMEWMEAFRDPPICLVSGTESL